MADIAPSTERLQERVDALQRELAECQAVLSVRRRQGETPAPVAEDAGLGASIPVTQIIWWLDAHGDITAFNEDWYAYTGQTAEEAHGRGWMNAIHPEDVAAVHHKMREVGVSGDLFEVEYRLQRGKRGEYRWHLSRGKSVKDENGRVLYWYGSVVDIDNLKRVEEELRKSQAILQAIVECLPFDFFALDMDGRYSFQNAACKEHWGPIVGKTPAEVSHSAANLAVWLENNRRAFAGEKVEGENTFCTHGENRSYHGVLAPICDAHQVYGILGINIDITARKRGEEALRQSEERYRNLAESTSDMIYIADATGALLYANRTAAASLGYEPETIVGKRQEELFPPEVALRHQESIAQVFASGETMRLDNVYTFAQETIWLHTSLTPLRDKEGRVTSVMGVSRNITERKQAEETLRKAHSELEQRVAERTAELQKVNEELVLFRKFAEASGEGFGMSTLDGRIVYVNPTLCRMFDVAAPEEIVGQQVFRYYPQDYPDLRANVLIPTLLRDGYCSTEQTILTRLGVPIETIQCTFLIRDENGAPFRLAAVVRDITERKRAETALRQAHDELGAIYDVMVDGLHLLDLETMRAVRTNPALCRMMGYTTDEIISLSPADVHPADALPQITETLQRHLANDVSWTEELPLVRKDGSVFYAEATGIKIVFNGRLCLMCCFRDITERRRAHEKLKREHRTLKHLLRSSDHERQLIAYEIHDGLAQQLAGAVMQFQTAQHLKDANPGLAARAYEAGMTMLQQSHFETRRLIAGVRPPILDESGVVAAVGHLVNEQCRIKGSNIEYRSSVAFDRLAPTLENAIYRIAQEGLANACTHSKSKRIRVSLTQREERVRVEIRDWGVGFDAKNVGDACYGLAGIRERARLLGGKCRIHSTQDEGTHILVELPLVTRED